MYYFLAWIYIYIKLLTVLQLSRTLLSVSMGYAYKYVVGSLVSLSSFLHLHIEVCQSVHASGLILLVNYILKKPE